MRRLPFHILFSCILMPPVLYILSLQALELVLQKRWTSELRQVLISDTRSLLDGHTAIEDEIKKNVEGYLSSRKIQKWGVLARVTVKTKTGRWLYPFSGKDTYYMFDMQVFPQQRPSPTPTEMLGVAEKNLKIMDEGIETVLTVQIPRNTWTANCLLILYLAVFTFILYRAYKKITTEARHLEFVNHQALETANENLMTAQERLKEVTLREMNYLDEIQKLKTDLAKVSGRVRETEDEALNQIEQLETSLNESVSLREELEIEVLRLTDELEKVESQQKTTHKKQQKQVDSTMKRFKTLYKNLEIQERAVDGFLNLEAELQLRAEEFIHQINEDHTRLTVKRKVFSKKGSVATFECEFGYRGRIYFRPGPGAKTQILAIGTKNSQAKDLAYLEGI